MSINRREALKTAALTTAALLAPGLAPGLVRAAPGRSRALRVAHLTDIHIQPELRAGQGAAAAFEHANTLADKPDLIITGGDHVFDSFDQAEPRAKLLWDLWTSALRDSNRLPMLSCIGNHDCWGWNRKKSKLTGDEPLYGKNRVVDALSLPGRYYSTDRNGWHIVCLDSVKADGDGYIGKIDDEQFEWLAGDLAASKSPVMIVSHIPIFSVAAMQFGGKDDRTKNEVDPSLMHIDAGRLHKLFLKHPRVRLCLSGHLHLVDRCDLDGVTYLCDGAVCGNWWKGRHQQCDEGYATIDLFDDGTFERTYQTYGWKAEPPAKKG